MITFFGIFALTCLMLAAPLAATKPSILRFCYALFVVVFGIVIPLGVFLLSALLIPEWKGDCSNGWLDCFHTGKLTLAPLVLWAIGALYVTEFKHGAISQNPGLQLGLFVGFTVAAGCFIYGCISLQPQSQGVIPFLLVPLYTAVWHGVRLGQVLQRSHPDPRWFLFTFLGTIPFWIAGLLWSQRLFRSLSDHPPAGCFVVTAASRGHPRLVGPITDVSHKGSARLANPQLIALWTFEQLWQTRFPHSHRQFRAIYNRLGPIVARQINSPIKADLVYLALKPVEWLARGMNHFYHQRLS